VAFAPYEFLWVVKESSYGTTMAAPTAGTDSIYIRLAGANRFTMRPKRGQIAIQHGGGHSIRGYTAPGKWEVTGNLEVELCYTQAAMLLGWAATRINGAQTAPWTTTDVIGSLASCSVFHGIMRSDGTIKRLKYKGVKVESWGLATSEDSPVAMLRLGLRAQKHDGNPADASSDPDATAFPAPADTAFPTDPVLFHHLADTGGLVLNAEVSCVNGVSFSGENEMDARYCGSQFLSFHTLRGRKITTEANVLYTASPNWRTDFEAQTARTIECLFSNTVRTLNIDLFDNNIMTAVEDDLTPGKVYDQTLSWETQFDTTTNEGDIAVTVTVL
jgi:hypothetical protein